MAVKKVEEKLNERKEGLSSSNPDEPKEATRLWRSISPEGWRKDREKTDPSLGVYFWLKEAPAEYAGATYTRLMVSSLRKRGRWLLARRDYDENDKEIHQHNIVKIDHSPAMGGRSNVEEVFHRAEQYMKENKPREGQELPQVKRTKWGALEAEKVEKPKPKQKTLTGEKPEPKKEKREREEEKPGLFEEQETMEKYEKEQKTLSEEEYEDKKERIERLKEDIEDVRERLKHG